MKKAIIGLVVMAAIVAGVFLFWRDAERGGSGDGVEPAEVGGPLAAAEEESRAPASRPAPVPRQSMPRVIEDDDPEGVLRLEGQVLDQGDLPVEGAAVTISTRPARTARTGKDGTFLFDKLIGRRYRLTARHGNDVGGPVIHKLTDRSDPAIIRLRLGAVVEVSVVAADSGQAVAGALVELRSADEQPAVTDAAGKATLRGVAGGYSTLAVQASGFAPAHQLLMVPESATEPVRTRVVLQRGAGVTGHVKDENGRAVVKARVVAIDTAALFDLSDAERDGALSDDQGRFVIQALAAGTYRLVASHEDYPHASSRAVEVAGFRPTEGIEIVMEPGASVSGRVVSGEGQAVPWAQVRIGTRSGTPFSGVFGGAQQRSTTADEQGVFELKGLPREELIVMAVGEHASSDTVPVDLRERSRVDGLELTLAVAGKIAGTVVTSSGEAVPEVEVSALPDIWAGGIEEGTRLRGRSFAVTDGAGRFVLKGLPEGIFRLRASRSSGAFKQHMQPGVQARTGDEDVELILDREGGLKGRVEFSDHGVPDRFSVAISFPPGVPFSGSGGAFELPEVAPGTYRVIIRGQQFADRVVPDVRVQAEQVTDIGVVRVKHGRMVTGRVVEENGSVVPGASVVLARNLVGDGTSLTLELGAGAEEQMGLRRTVSDADGAFRIGGVGTEQFVIVAEHEKLGRSTPATLLAGTVSPSFDLTLHGFGSVTGKVTSGGEPAKGAIVSATVRGETSQTIVVHAGDDGSFLIARLPAGEHRIGANLVTGGGLGSRGEARMVTVRAGERLVVDIDLPTGHVDLTVHVQGADGATIDSAQILILKGQVQLSVAADLAKAAASAEGGIMSSFWMPAKPAQFAELVPGEYSLCAIPINGDMNDPAFLQKLQKHRMSLKVHCSPLVVESSPQSQTHTAVIPPMDPLPPDPPADTTP